jgi:hypothetical protein
MRGPLPRKEGIEHNDDAKCAREDLSDIKIRAEAFLRSYKEA